MSSSHALVVGKFGPFHPGHARIIDYCVRSFSFTTIVVSGGKNGPGSPNVAIFNELLYSVLGMLPKKYHDCFRIVVVEDTNQNPRLDKDGVATNPEFWEYWRTVLASYGPFSDVVGGEPYVEKLAEVLSTKENPVEPTIIPRESLPLSATQVRSDLIRYWDYMSQPAQSRHQKLVIINGPECSGKTTLVNSLKILLGERATVVEEYGRKHSEYAKDDIAYKEDFLLILARHRKAILDGKEQGQPFVLVDTDYVTTYWQAKAYGVSLQLKECLPFRIKGESMIVMCPPLEMKQDGYRKEDVDRQMVFDKMMEHYSRNPEKSLRIHRYDGNDKLVAETIKSLLVWNSL